MRAVVDAAQAAPVDVAVDLSRRQRAVPQQLLDRPQVGASLEQVGRERVPQAVRVRKQPPEHARVEPAPAGGEEKSVLGAAREQRAGVAQVQAQPVGGLFAERHRAFLASLPADSDELLLEVDIGKIEIDRLSAPEAGGVDELDEGSIPKPERVVALETLEGRLDLGRFRRVRQPSGPSGARDVGHPAGAQGETQERSNGGQLTRDRRRCESAGSAAGPGRAELGGVGGEYLHFDLVEPCSAAAQPGVELLDVHAVRAPRRVGESRTGKESLDRGLCVHGVELFAPHARLPSSKTARVRRPMILLAAAAACLVVPSGGPPGSNGRVEAFPHAGSIRVPAGFRAEVYASGLRKPTAIAFSPGGRLYVTEEGGQITMARPRSRAPAVVARGFHTPLGLAWLGQTLYVSAQGTLWRLAGGRRTALVAGLPFRLHQQDNVVVGRDGRLYFGSGSTCNACKEGSRLSAAVLSVRPDGKGLRVVSSGLRNPFGLAVQPGTGHIFASVNGRDDLGKGEPAEAVVEIRAGRFFGWPRCWPSAARLRLAGRCTGTSRPAAYLEPHSSADGMAFYDGGAFPPSYRGNLFVAEWGTYFGHRFGRRLVRVRLDPAGRGARARVSVFASGFDHPLAVAVDRLGALLVADHGRGVIYRIQASGRP